MRDPAEYGDRDHYSERVYIDTNIDNGGVHTNSGIPNHAYYLLVNGGFNAGCDAVGSNDHTHTADCSVNVSLPGIGLEDAEGNPGADTIFYGAFTALPSNAAMSNARDATVAMACTLFGTGGSEPKSTSDAWAAVGLTNTTTPLCPPLDTTAPAVTSVLPMNSTTAVNPGTDVVIRFSEPVNGVDTAFTLNSGGADIPGTVTVADDRQSATFVPENSLPANTDINVNVNTSVTDDSDNNLEPSFNSTFTTGETPEVTGPTVTKIVIKVEQKGPNYQAIADVYSDQDTLIEGTFDWDGLVLNSDSGTVVGGEEFVRLQSKKVRASGEFTITITNTTLSVPPECSVSGLWVVRLPASGN